MVVRFNFSFPSYWLGEHLFTGLLVVRFSCSTIFLMALANFSGFFSQLIGYDTVP